MKRIFIITLAIVCLGVNQQTYAKIRNGYQQELKAVQLKLDYFYAMDKGTLSKAQRTKLKKRLKITYSKAASIQKNHAKTHALIEMLRLIDPELYYEINSIKDSEGNETDVYVKVVDNLGPIIEGTTNLGHSLDNPNVYNSEYGDHTVSVRIARVNPRTDLLNLVHELGHVRYQVPHLAEYTEYYKKVYQKRYYKGIEFGHLPGDPSNQSVKETLKTFYYSRREYNRETKELARHTSLKMLVSNLEN